MNKRIVMMLVIIYILTAIQGLAQNLSIDTSYDMISLNYLPNISAANFTWKTLYDHTILFNDTSIGGPFVEYTWDFNNDTIIDDYGKNVVYTYPDDGLYYVTHYVKDYRGRWYYITKPVGVGFPTADFEWKANGLNVTFIDKSVDPDGKITYRGWDFTGDGVFDDYGEKVVYRFHEAGIYRVYLLVQDDDGHSDAIIKNVTVTPYTPDLECQGSLSWSNVKPNEEVQGSFTVSNIGDANSTLNWRIISYPTWGNWTFTPDRGYNLKPSDGSQIVQVKVVAPGKRNYAFTGTIKVINMDNPSDYDTIQVSLVTSKSRLHLPLSIRYILESILHLNL